MKKPSRKNLQFSHYDTSNSAITKSSWKVLDSVGMIFPIWLRWSRVRMSLTRPWRSLLFDCGESKLECLWFELGHDAMVTKSSYKVLDSTAMTSLIRPWQNLVRKSWIWSRRHLWFVHDEAESENLWLGRDDLTDLAMMKVSQKVFNLATVTFSIWSWHRRVRRVFDLIATKANRKSLQFGRSDPLGPTATTPIRSSDLTMTKWCQKVLDLAIVRFRHDEVEVPTPLWQSRVKNSWIRLQRRLQFGHDEPELESLRFDYDDLFESAMTKPSWNLFGSPCGDLSNSAMTKASQGAFDSAMTMMEAKPDQTVVKSYQ